MKKEQMKVNTSNLKEVKDYTPEQLEKMVFYKPSYTYTKILLNEETGEVYLYKKETCVKVQTFEDIQLFLENNAIGEMGWIMNNNLLKYCNELIDKGWLVCRY